MTIDGDSGQVFRLDKVGRVFRHQYGDRWALRNVDLSVGDGEFVSVIGRSGCGKTTLIRLMDGLDVPSEGSVYFDGVLVQRVPAGVGFVFQDVSLLPWRSVFQNVELGLRSLELSKTERHDRTMEALALVGLEREAYAAPYTLSGGMQQRVGVARALALRPRVLLMDEPFGQLDNFTREQLQNDFAKLVSSLAMSVIFVTHDIDEAIFLSSRVVVIGGTSGGRIVVDLPVPLPELRWEYNLRAHANWVPFRDQLVEAVKSDGTGVETQGATAVVGR